MDLDLLETARSELVAAVRSQAADFSDPDADLAALVKTQEAGGFHSC